MHKDPIIYTYQLDKPGSYMKRNKLAYLIIFFFYSPIFICGCSMNEPLNGQTASNFIQRRHVTLMGKHPYPAKNPKFIAIFDPAHQPKIPYRVIGVASVAKYNLFGKERNENAAEI